MQDLSNEIRDYYFDHYGELAFDKQFHLASRLYLWDRDVQAAQKLQELKAEFTADGQPDQALGQVIDFALQSPAHGSKNAAELRRPYFEKYPRLKAYASGLFRVAFLSHIYGFDIRQTFFKHFPEAELAAFARELLADPQAIAILSTHAINFLYLYSRVLKPDSGLFEPRQFLEIGQRYYDTGNKLHLQLLVYLYTHCIIGESQFYYRAVPDNPVYQEMVEELEKLIDRHFQDINLDNKFEFLVCARMLGSHSQLVERIYDEAARSLAPGGTFLIDRHNSNPQTSNADLGTSEHRNVLCMLSARAYKPLVTA